ncbi:cytochrome c oxidase subunit 3 family protein [Bradyrhizobium erythrophlei]|uniref:cytochrome c oxidase subunit 3 family protein n=1 Tax=Bradyrhizobium erythrophlei TaxID=1437360 RepID=UPI0035EDFCA5
MPAQEFETESWGVLAGLPGEPMIWVLIFSEFAVFGLLLGAFAVARFINPSVFSAGQAVLDPSLAGLNTLALVTSGWAAAHGALAARQDRRHACRRWLALAIGLGGAFVAIKILEYINEVAAGAGLETSTFFTVYFLLTGFHLLHVHLGMVILTLVARGADAAAVETGTSFWHMVDLVWIVMFPIIYLVR